MTWSFNVFLQERKRSSDREEVEPGSLQNIKIKRSVEAIQGLIQTESVQLCDITECSVGDPLKTLEIKSSGHSCVVSVQFSFSETTHYTLEAIISLLYFSSVSRGLGELSPLSDSLLDEGLLMK